VWLSKFQWASPFTQLEESKGYKVKKPVASLSESPMPMPVNTAQGGIKTPSLQNIRDRHLRHQTDTANLIAELDAWRKEIDATIAFLRARDG